MMRLRMVTLELGLLPQEMQWDQQPMKCIYTNVHIMGNKQEEMEAVA